MFLTLGLLVFPSELPHVAMISILMSLVVMFISRPISVFMSTIFSKYNLKEKCFISWVGLRGVVPIILATYPLSAELENGQMIFNIIFFMVLISVLTQGTTLNKSGKIFGVIEPSKTTTPNMPSSPISYSDIKQYKIGESSKVIGKNLTELGLPDDFLIILAKRNGELIKVSGSFEFMQNDILLILCNSELRYQKIIRIYEL